MTIIDVPASRNYQVIVGSGLLSQAGSRVAPFCKGNTAAIVSDETVWGLYGSTLEASLKTAGLHVIHYTFPAGEASKNGEIYLKILNFLAENKLTRSDVLVALGGGVTGDLTGFVAATYLRGIAYVQIPTSLLSMVDSSVGGKTAIDLPAGKNLAGAFYQPSLVLCDMDALSTLPQEIFRDGCGEIIKYGVLYDKALFDKLLAEGFSFDREAVIARCVEWKRNVVAEDEFDTGARQKLNLGHTIGHGIEAQSHFTVSHGEAVATGMAIVARAGEKAGITSGDTVCAIHEILEKFGFPLTTGYSAQQLFTSALWDKKRSGGTVNLVVPREIGDCILLPTPVEQLQSFIKAGLA